MRMVPLVRYEAKQDTVHGPIGIVGTSGKNDSHDMAQQEAHSGTVPLGSYNARRDDRQLIRPSTTWPLHRGLKRPNDVEAVADGQSLASE